MPVLVQSKYLFSAVKLQKVMGELGIFRKAALHHILSLCRRSFEQHANHMVQIFPKVLHNSQGRACSLQIARRLLLWKVLQQQERQGSRLLAGRWQTLSIYTADAQQNPDERLADLASPTQLQAFGGSFLIAIGARSSRALPSLGVAAFIYEAGRKDLANARILRTKGATADT